MFFLAFSNDALSYFAVLVAILLVVLQQCVLLFVMVSALGGAICLLWLIVDLPWTLYSLVTTCQQANSGTSVAIQWFVYCMALAGKIGFIFFWPDQEALLKFGTGAELVLYMTPIINVLLVHRARTGPGGMFVTSKEQLSMEGLLHYDVMTNVSLDLLDLTAQYSLSRRTLFVDDNNLWLHMFLGVVLVNGFLCLSLTFPSSTAAEKKINLTTSDIFLTAKHATITALFFIDIPLLFYRIYSLLLRPTSGVLLFVFKNVLSIPYRSFRLHQSRLAERQQAKGSQRAFYGERICQSVDPTKVGALDAASNNIGRHSVDWYAGREELWVRCGLDSEKVGKALLSSRLVVARLRTKCERLDTPSHRVIKDLRSVRRIPVIGFSCISIFYRLVRCLSIGGRRTYSVLLDGEPHESHWRQLRLLTPMLVAWCSQIVIISLQWYQMKQDNSNFRSRQWNNLSIYDYWSFGICFSNAVIFFVFFFGTAPILEVLFVSLLWTLRLFSFFLSVGGYWIHRNEDSTSFVASVWIWSIQPLVGLLSVLPVMINTLIGRRYLSSCLFVKEDYEPALVSNTSVLLFLLCRNQFAPVSYHNLIIGPDIVKSVKLIEGLGQSSWRDFMIVFVIKFWCVLLSYSVVSLAVFIAHILFLLLYIIIVHTIRQIRLRMYEIRFMFANSLRRRQGCFAASAGVGAIRVDNKITIGSSYDSGSVFRKSYLTLLDLEIEHLESGFFSSPGTVLPSFL
eukprot:GHVS01037861.1.p1 GENE.GHVS01037861.1~~GHVS01037861.1.p1  ORF type:complete len:735 (-),score=23.54 GHVS01037861.1:229-2433(-)